MHENAETIEAEAARWLARHDAGSLSADERGSFEAWCAQNPRHLGAFVRLQAVSARLDRAAALVDMPVYRSQRTRPAWRFAAAAIVTLAVIAVPLWLARTQQQFITEIGEQHRATLADGTSIELNTATSIAVDLTDVQRVIRLSKGEALFEVAKDPHRPFVVQTDLAQVRAIGTVFSVRAAERDAVSISVTEGIVAIEKDGHPIARVTAGETFRLARSGESEQRKEQRPEIGRALAWRDGKVAFAGETLAAAIAEINRYNTLHIEIGDASIANLRVGGYFRATDPDGFVDALTRSLPVQARRTDGAIVLESVQR